MLLFAAVAAASSPPLVATAQSADGIVSGTVRGEAGPLAGATVTIVGGATRTVTSGNDGTFRITGLPAGTYRLSVSRGGYKTSEDQVIAIGATPAAVTIALEPATLTTIGRTSVTNRATAINVSPAAVVTVSGQTYQQRGNFQVSNILEEQPGVELSRYSSGGGPGANTVVALRGADPYETQTLIDGHPVSGGPGGSFLIQFLNPLLLNDIEIGKGPGNFGNTIQNAIGGSVNFRTPDITRKPSGEVSVGYDSYNGSTYAVRYSNTFGKIGVLVGAARFGTPGYYSDRPILYATPDGNAQTGSVPNATINQAIPSSETFDNKSQLVKLGYNFSPSTTLTIGYFGGQTYADYTGNLTTAEPVHIVGGPCSACGSNGGNSGNPSYTNPALSGYVGQTVLASTVFDNLYLGNYELDNEPIFSGDFRTGVGPGTFLARYYAGSINRIIADPAEANQILQCDDPTCNFALAQANGDTSGAYYQKQLDILHGAELEYDLPLGASTLTVAYDAHNDRTTACSGPDPLFGQCSVRNLLLKSNTLSVRGDFALNAKTRLQLADYFSSTTLVGHRSDPRLALTYRPAANLVLRAAAGTSYVAPFPDILPHLSGRTLDLTAPGGLRPESSMAYNVGLDLATTRDSKVTVDAYNTVIRDRFATAYVQKLGGVFGGAKFSNTQYSYNQANTENRGLELSYLKQPRVGLGGSLAVDLLRSYAFGSNYLGTPFPNGQANAQGNYGVEADGAQLVGYPYNKDRAQLTYAFPSTARIALGATVYGAVNSFNERGFTLFDASAMLPLRDGFQLLLSAQNVFNHDEYRTLGQYAYGYAPPVDPQQIASGASAFSPQTLGFAPPRQVTIQLVHPIGRK